MTLSPPTPPLILKATRTDSQNSMQSFKQTKTMERSKPLANNRTSNRESQQARPLPKVIAIGVFVFLMLVSLGLTQNQFAAAQTLSPSGTNKLIANRHRCDCEKCGSRCHPMKLRNRIIESYRPLQPAGDMVQRLPYEKNISGSQSLRGSYYARPYQGIDSNNSDGFQIDESARSVNAFDTAEDEILGMLQAISQEGYLEFNDWRQLRNQQKLNPPLLTPPMQAPFSQPVVR